MYVEDQSLTFDPNVPNLPGNVTLDGYWQSERYFTEFTETLRREITVRNPVSGENQRWYDLISDTGSVSVHVRRGDYVDLGWALPPSYYRNALNQIQDETDVTDLFFFSDNIDWIRTNQKDLVPDHSDTNVHYVECNDGETAHEDLRLMRACDHHIVANSSFSWWGAWLDNSETKIVIAPDYWVHDPVNHLDIIPDRWDTVSW
ncbi:alpha-1,2-fucosyltransferase [Halorubrum sp. T3]|uniref:alpha-1,2-fucosyltransferase n=1 Tax=Halorubrum sp. T3 TaxID=1194088 RepID=UPI00178C51CE|nr:alpha-1,2-fucosyltransferase [Halorubrum sp. T3]